jgi:hypothetical protein
MLVLDVDRFGRKQAKALQQMPSERRFAVTVLAGFAAALTLLAILFAFTGDSAAARGGRAAGTVDLAAHDPATTPAVALARAS